MTQPAPSTKAIADTIVTQVEASLEQTVPLLPKAFIRVLAKALAGVIVLIYRYAGFALLQMFVASATMRETTVNGRTFSPLVEWGRLIGVGDPLAASRAEFMVGIPTSVDASGSLPAGTQLLYSQTGVVYLTTASTTLTSPTTYVRVRASSDPSGGGGAGAIGNVPVGAVLTMVKPIGFLSRNGTVPVDGILVTGAAAETEESYRARIIRRFQQRPQGGAPADYRAWGEALAGITHVYPYRGAPGVVQIYAEASVESSGDPDGIPTFAQLEAVREAMEFDIQGRATRRPITAAVTVDAITRTPFDVRITGLAHDDPAYAESVIEQAVDLLLRSREPFLVGLSVLPRLNRITQAAVAGAADDAASAIGATIAKVDLFLEGVETPAYTLGEGEKAKLGATTYV